MPFEGSLFPAPSVPPDLEGGLDLLQLSMLSMKRFYYLNGCRNGEWTSEDQVAWRALLIKYAQEQQIQNFAEGERA